MKESPQSAGGRAWARIQRDRALINYYVNPNLCLFCNNIIQVKGQQKVREARDKKFCSRSCSASYNNSTRKIGKQCNSEKKVKVEAEEKTVPKKVITFLSLTRLELYTRSLNNYAARSAICKNARYVYKKSDRDKFCSECNYTKYYEVCHIKAVSDFNDDSLIREINDLDNLIALCPNCHWEHDNLPV